MAEQLSDGPRIGLRARAEGLYQRLAGRAVAALPGPPEQLLLGSTRARMAALLVERRGAEIAAARAAWLDGAARGDLDGPRAALGALGESLIGELRAAVRGAVSGRGLGRLAAIADGWLPTDEEEHLDRPGFDEVRRTRELRGIDRLNRGFGSYARFADALAPLLDGPSPDSRPLTVLDIASGHGGFPLALASLLPRAHSPIRLIASDLRDEYLEIGRREAARQGISGVEFIVADALRLEERFAPGEIDVITCTQSLHHFGAAAVCGLLAEAVRHARRGVLFIDLVRAPTATAAASLLGLLARDGALMHDAVLSFRKAFVPEELGLLAACVPGGERLEAIFLPPAFTALRTRR